ncbi:hypothetical protein AMES_4168 [Amycolatopsis mediterranei S699]|uniref:Uncharacterized protein n=2 Tax=Amycolatopsis mediterranei TaxID=33910 RepID=A0A0H3D7D1_AMYMU|nr:hypothetical protein [Amycolatopsis mediterranei]ADJ45993.1 hypothetical protein AMED_4218 [Amycolatopsis mediterranei U32]AEK42777.1 hypothetical protein RAM_21485 [Amycolatopsis mediterranei S699]AFO77704.1 hypothetical protein AMES_4168 [Amycolatopsis mediterranei S699]AGT84832.1 hypothetical protein B737_4168 [Amycolatopsis mediterranei RB]KDO05528.1 hypothetical protein DV26_38490 [Amycolatopsis mediterranei]
MAERRWHFIPATAWLCWLNLAVGALVLLSSILTLTGTEHRMPVLPVVAAVIAVGLIVVAAVGLARPKLRGR